ncbi:MAG: hypothetical protein KDC05_10170 [Bacteroidales bacterium]|nr:hypothetical protein [Bacteroidales bacterium]
MRKKILLLLTIFSIILFFNVKADNPPDPGGGPTGDPVGGGSPVGSGMVITLLLSAGYASKKLYHLKEKK